MTSAAAIFAAATIGLASNLLPQSPADAVYEVFSEIEELVADDPEAPGLASSRKERQGIAPLKDRIAALGPDAVEPLAEIALDKTWPLKARVWAVSFLGAGREPGALSALGKLLLDASQPSALRRAAAAELPLLSIAPHLAREPLCRALADHELPLLVADEAVHSIQKLGCDEGEHLLWWAWHGPEALRKRPDIRKRLLAALSNSGPSGAQALLSLVFYSPKGAPEREAILRLVFKHSKGLLADPAASGRALKEIRSQENRANPRAALIADKLLNTLSSAPPAAPSP